MRKSQFHSAVYWLIGLLALSSTAAALENPLFTTYIALGDSLTQGNQGGSVEQTRQGFAYPALLAQAMGSSYTEAPLRFPGNGVNPEDFLKGNIKWWQYYYVLVGGVRADRFRNQDTLSNFGITGATASDLVDTTGQTGMHKLVLGRNGATAIVQAMDRNPTFVSLWIGSNDVLNAVLFGDDRLITPLDEFQAKLEEAAAIINQTPSVQGVAIANIPDVTEIAFLEDGNDGAKDVALAGFLSATEAIEAATVNVITQQVQAMNAIIAQVAADNGWALVDIHSNFQNIVENDHVLTDAAGELSDIVITREYLGGLFSLDGMHFSTTGQAVFGNFFISAINAFYHTNLAQIDEVAAAEQDTLLQAPVDPRILLQLIAQLF